MKDAHIVKYVTHICVETYFTVIVIDIPVIVAGRVKSIGIWVISSVFWHMALTYSYDLLSGGNSTTTRFICELKLYQVHFTNVASRQKCEVGVLTVITVNILHKYIKFDVFRHQMR